MPEPIRCTCCAAPLITAERLCAACYKRLAARIVAEIERDMAAEDKRQEGGD